MRGLMEVSQCTPSQSLFLSPRCFPCLCRLRPSKVITATVMMRGTQSSIRTRHEEERPMRIAGFLTVAALSLCLVGCGEAPPGPKGDAGPAGPPGPKGDAG